LAYIVNDFILVDLFNSFYLFALGKIPLAILPHSRSDSRTVLVSQEKIKNEGLRP
jgi:hypothetical protein